MGVFSAMAIAIHNFPEGLATFIAALKDPTLGISIGIAIAIHNIPEGIAVSVPIYFATGSKKNAVFGVVFAIVAGIMVYISLDELLPRAEKYGEHHIAIYGLISGMAVMAVSLILFA